MYPGSFDPLTYGHIDLVNRALEIFDEVHVTIAPNEEKTPLFSAAERLSMVRRALADRGPRLVVQVVRGLVVDYARENGILTIIRGLRATSDFDYEFQMALTNRAIAKDVDTIFLMPAETHLYLSSRLVKEIARFGGDVSFFVPKFISTTLKKKFRTIR